MRASPIQGSGLSCTAGGAAETAPLGIFPSARCPFGGSGAYGTRSGWADSLGENMRASIDRFTVHLTVGRSRLPPQMYFGEGALLHGVAKLYDQYGPALQVTAFLDRQLFAGPAHWDRWNAVRTSRLKQVKQFVA